MRESKRVFLGKLRRSDQSPFLRVPGGEQDRALWTMARSHELRDAASRFEDARRTAYVVGRARTPGIAMGTDDHQLVGVFASPSDAEGVVDHLRPMNGAIVGDLHARSHRTGSHVIAKR